ncbi:MAG: hypothetical protein KAJ47_01510 [Candidatus Aenigmarchaeota archaeon]|nr:hypothetical protein [Candidatus Aenigmarchaeota archaeon]
MSKFFNEFVDGNSNKIELSEETKDLYNQFNNTLNVQFKKAPMDFYNKRLYREQLLNHIGRAGYVPEADDLNILVGLANKYFTLKDLGNLIKGHHLVLKSVKGQKITPKDYCWRSN